MAQADDNQDRPGLRALLTAASVVIVVWGLHWAAPVLLPILAAAFLAVLCIPPMRRLERQGLPPWLALTLVVIGASMVVLLVVALVGTSVSQFQEQLGFYQRRLNEIVADGAAWLQSRGLDVEPGELTSQLNTGAIMKLAGDTAAALVAAAGNVFVIVLTMIFILIEANALPDKLRAARRAGRGGEVPGADDLAGYADAARKVHDYLALKALVSAATGIAAALLTYMLGLDFALTWGLLAFLFNFVPNIGSIIAAIPPVLLALISADWVIAATVAAGYGLINLVLGNLIEPKLMGDRLGLSTLVVFVSLIFWGWVWGPVGMLLSVPLTVIIKILLEHSDDLRPLAVMLGPSPDGDTKSG